MDIPLSSRQLTAGVLRIAVPHVTPEANNVQVMSMFSEHKSLIGLPVLEQNRPIGMINRHIFLSQMSRPFFHELYDQKSCIAFMDKTPLIVEADAGLDYLAERVIETGDKAITEGFILTEDNQYIGIGLGLDLIRTVSDLQAKQHMQIMQSIEYARIIQESMLSRSRQNIEQTLDDWCLYWHPRDCVGGDIYAFQRCENGWLLVLADCTGHGVPGAFMTFIFSSALEKALTQAQPHEPERLLASINHYIKQTLSQSHPTADMGQSNDGCDAIAVFVDTQNEQLIWSNARMHAFMLGTDDADVINLDGDRKGIGYSDTATDYQWQRHQRPLRRGDTLLIVTDGVTDQIGGPREIMFGKKRIQSLLLQQRALPMSSVSEALLSALTDWQGKQSARDDMTWFGFRW
ncbi:TPA: SpoIIE family protein phosphatase [Kluyvera intermedia]|uniref:Protein serine/threonine phosphatase n=2 Tax=Enterobacteriaceae TaxID=543 RepID=A0AAC8TN41_9ENTR|nr:SpoIIE family protein phosphatase [Phytobacter ursingii]MDU6683602.1 SpoIIE family protein phosphatase [Enterobacteriaceae bacterium]HAT2205379.1 SpoIIE family protein phosphatase [Kluyvera intermedia]AKL13174.1 protein serine/threonine phosphatase [Phytobacter ursingii]HAT2516105.1 SpoIIE family protein phosphatase [Kluyvera intermedia]HAT2603788.1 SpoIIE family protein phosphatase [Kluyvera intermedia]